MYIIKDLSNINKWFRGEVLLVPTNSGVNTPELTHTIYVLVLF